MRILGCITIQENLLDRTFTDTELKEFNLYKICENDLKYRMTVWDNDVLFDDYYDISELLDGGFDETEELCDYIVKQWEKKLPKITDVEFSQPDVEGWVDTVYIVDCDWKEMYKQMKGEQA